MEIKNAECQRKLSLHLQREPSVSVLVNLLKTRQAASFKVGATINRNAFLDFRFFVLELLRGRWRPNIPSAKVLGGRLLPTRPGACHGHTITRS